MAYRFDGIGDELTVSGSLPDPAAFTWMAWFRWHADDENYNCLFEWGLAESSGDNFTALVIDGGNAFPAPFGNNALLVNTGEGYGGGSIISPSVWHHVAYVKNGTTHTVYLDGILDFEFTANPTLPPAGTVNFGNNPFSEVFNGRLDHIKMWSAALSAAEVAAEMEDPEPVRSSNLYGWWAGDTLDVYTDLSGNGHTLVETGSVTIETGPGLGSGGIINVASGGDLQAALNAAVDGDEIRLEAGATFTGNFTIPFRTPQIGMVTVRTAGTLPDRRIDISDAASLATLSSANNGSTLDVGGAANAGWTFQGVRIIGGIQTLVSVAGADTITFDRCLIVGGANGTTRGIAGNGTNITVHRCYISNFWQSGQDAQAFAAWDGAGPYTLTDNYLEASGENVLFGGADPPADADMPADILVEDNHFFKPLSWKTDSPHRLVKNIFELKVGARVTIRRNRFENCWTDGQTGFAIVFTPRNQDSTAPWSRIEDILFEDNVVIAERGLSMIGYDDLQPSGRCQRLVFRRSLFVTEQLFFQCGGEALDVTFDHLTIANAADRIATLYFGDVRPAGESQRPALYAISDLTWTNCTMSSRTYGIFAEGDGQGQSALNFQVLNGAAGYVWTNNAVADPFLSGDPGTPVAYPEGTLTPSQATHDAQFADTSTYPLVVGSIYRGVGTNGSDLGWLGGVPATIERYGGGRTFRLKRH